MRTLISYELKKLRLVAVVAVTVLCCTAAFFVLAIGDGLFERMPDIKKSAALAEGELTQEKIDLYLRLHEEMTNSPDSYGADGRFKPEVEEKFYEMSSVLNLINVQAYRQKTVQYLNDRLAMPHVDGAERALLQKQLDMYAKEGNLVGGYFLFYDRYVEFEQYVAPFLLGFLLIFLLAPIGSMEHATRTEGLFLATRRGRRAGALAKLTVAWILTTGAFLLVMGSYALVSGAVLGVDGADASLCQLFDFLLTPYPLTVGQYWLCSLGVVYVACLGFASLVVLLSTLCQNRLSAVGIGAALFYLPYLVCLARLDEQSEFGIFHFTYAHLMQVTPLFTQFSAYVVGGHAVTQSTVQLLAMALATVVCTFAAYRLMRRRQVKN